MAVDPAVVGPLAARLMDKIGEEYGEDAEIRSVVVAVEIDTEEETETRYEIEPRSSITLAGFGATFIAAGVWPA